MWLPVLDLSMANTELGSQKSQSVTFVQGAAESPSQNFGEATGAQKLCAGKNSGECNLVILRSLTGRDREGKLANTTIDGEYNLSGQELPLSIKRLYLSPHGQIRQCCSETQNRDYLL